MVRVLIVDDERLVRAGLRMVLAGEPDLEVVGEAVDGVEAVEAVRRLEPDVVLMDLGLPRLDGVAATAALRRGSPVRPQVVVVTTFLADGRVLAALRAGAVGYVLKDAPEEQLIAAVRAAGSGAGVLDPRVVAQLVDGAAGPTGGAVDPRIASLTAREQEVLRLLAEGVSNDELARRLHIGAATVKTHVARVFEKLGLETRAQAVAAAYETGFVRPQSPGLRP